MGNLATEATMVAGRLVKLPSQGADDWEHAGPPAPLLSDSSKEWKASCLQLQFSALAAPLHRILIIACTERVIYLAVIKVERTFDFMRSDSRFQDLQRRVGF
jgi:hypothetical protein